MTIRVICKNCNSKLDAKDELRGQTRLCPKCRQPVLIEPVETSGGFVSTGGESQDAEFGTIKPLRLEQNNMYVVLGSSKEVAYWKFNEGWYLNVGNGYQLVKRVPDQIPDVGDYVLVEGYVELTDAGRRLRGLRFKALTGRAVLRALLRSETEVLEKAKFSTTLSQAQKRFLLEHIRKHYFFEFTDGSPEITEYLTGFDAHSTEVGTFKD